MAFQKGQSGNPGGKRAEKLFSDALHLAVKRIDEGDPEGRTKLQRMADSLVDQAAAGNLVAIGMIADRLEGKAKQQTEVTGADDGPLQVIFRTFGVEVDSSSSR